MAETVKRPRASLTKKTAPVGGHRLIQDRVARISIEARRSCVIDHPEAGYIDAVCAHHHALGTCTTGADHTFSLGRRNVSILVVMDRVQRQVDYLMGLEPAHTFQSLL